jgi:Cell wall-associated hydrolases (invasion-associated proteins)
MEEKMKDYKRCLRGVVAGAVMTCVLAATAFAYSGAGTVKVSTYLNVRSSPSTSASIVGKLYNGTKVTIVDSSNGWYKISFNGSTAWISGSYVTLSSAAGRIQTVISTANSVLGVKYVYGGASPSTGFDCSGLVLYAFSKAGVTLPHNASMQSTLGVPVSRASLQPGDVIFFSTDGSGSINHNGIYIGNGSFINAQSGAGDVQVASLSVSYWSSKYITARRYIS